MEGVGAFNQAVTDGILGTRDEGREALENLSLTGKLERRRGSGRPCIKLMDGIADDIAGGVTASQLLQIQDIGVVVFHGCQRLQEHGTSVR